MIRQAKQTDAPFIIPPLYETIGAIGNTLAGTTDPTKTIEILSAFFALPNNRLSYLNTWVLEMDHQIAGFFVAYAGDQSEQLDRPFLDRSFSSESSKISIDKEPEPGEFYLDTLYVHPNFRGQALGRQLLIAFEKIGSELGFSRFGLLVEKENLPAYHLYQKIGYHPDKEKRISETLYQHMILEKRDEKIALNLPLDFLLI
ncbi:GNAT family N-acetyltransferase [Risungbinella massiliensis]|uniref:GNAT family N-acetyltransferase n=1 Tax=Risungbinella massiliensis TaxID=1329796 RepID=UPI0005CBC937|nr:N-acetyltransferase [Risungbinella massiliensis]